MLTCRWDDLDGVAGEAGSKGGQQPQTATGAVGSAYQLIKPRVTATAFAHSSVKEQIRREQEKKRQLRLQLQEEAAQLSKVWLVKQRSLPQHAPLPIPHRLYTTTTATWRSSWCPPLTPATLAPQHPSPLVTATPSQLQCLPWMGGSLFPLCVWGGGGGGMLAFCPALVIQT